MQLVVSMCSSADRIHLTRTTKQQLDERREYRLVVTNAHAYIPSPQFSTPIPALQDGKALAIEIAGPADSSPQTS